MPEKSPSKHYTLQEHEFMAHAIQLAKKGTYTTSPNPNVGCVIVKNNKIISQGWHKKAGSGHAEVNALADVSVEDSLGATAYVTLEPCSHYGRTPPCALRLIEAKVATVFVAMLDPNPQVAGNGIAILKGAGIEVHVGLLEADARALNYGFFSRMEKNKPFVRVKLASSLDGKTALSNGESKWITGPSARADVQKYRAASCAILTTAQTVLVDNARLNVREEQLEFMYPYNGVVTQIRQPIKVILDGHNRIKRSTIDELDLFNIDLDSNSADTPGIVIIKSNTGLSEFQKEFKDRGDIRIIGANYDQQSGFDIAQVLAICSSLQINNLWVEAGGKLAGSFIVSNLFDELIVYVAPKLMGIGGMDLVPFGPLENMSQTKSLNLLDCRVVGEDIRLTYSPKV
ncbi:bifunctional diaminohydroxyphosphoribosylaminopyrimidine deaminase/5-amino-6-(5-phosphoribosylamino)uracil reductase RibD [Psychrosphaera aestuarii]|uniref:bifunctional diaminohydroxyphosphoribosylaminopyrimidine deaminase/5-amino-6-(5-phosphoribosylamino)uracil reductase RibD n=1 Tax=Psychrosphaera aestuarii TaxID=1266052 RepID=UPI001B32D6B9|nr:bifunctional diaminohydroxyphosphoribosylaminopyrimidine deaminase/5-amino-6-(5-phosphoribosylamino)uracil reductase RibD [Psychrosphaera aestuarii]